MPSFQVFQESAHRGFLLGKEVAIFGSVSVFVGKNGSGKTRFFDSIKNGLSRVTLDGKVLDPRSEIEYLSVAQLAPNFEIKHEPDLLTQGVANATRAHKKFKRLLDLPYDPGRDELDGRAEGGVTYSAIYKLSQHISKLTGKDPSELNEADIRLHFSPASYSAFGRNDVSRVFNEYHKRIHDNQYFRFRKEQLGHAIYFLSEEDFHSRFGPPPWDIINGILKSVFDGKFRFPAPPDMQSELYDHQTPLLDSGGRQTSLTELSSGERILLWLALSLFNSQCSDRGLLNAPRLLLLDEPDAYLHPKMVEKMYEVLERFHAAFGTVFWFITHSPTTVALAPVDSLYLVLPDGIESFDRDAAVAELLDGVPHIALLPENRRNVYVESHYDAVIYQCLFDFLKRKSRVLLPKVSMSFVAAGAKIPEAHLVGLARSIFGISDERKISEYVEAINGSGSCSQVYAAAAAMRNAAAIGVRGLVDWDAKNSSESNVVVIGEGFSYSIENIVLDPVCVLLQLNLIDPVGFDIGRYVGLDVLWPDWLQDSSLIQIALDRFIFDFLGSDNHRDSPIEYFCGLVLLSDRRYMCMNGHELEARIWSMYPVLNKIARRNRDGDLKLTIVQNVMINASGGKLIPRAFEEAFAKLQG